MCLPVIHKTVYAWTVECSITRKHLWGWFDWLVLLQAYKLSSYFSPLPCSLFYQTGMPGWATFGSGSLILLAVSQQTSCRLFHGFCVLTELVLFYRLECSVEQVLTVNLFALALADYWLWGVWIMLQVPLTLGQSRVIDWIAHDRVRWVGQRLNKFHGTIQIFTRVLTAQLCWLSMV